MPTEAESTGVQEAVNMVTREQGDGDELALKKAKLDITPQETTKYTPTKR